MTKAKAKAKAKTKAKGSQSAPAATRKAATTGEAAGAQAAEQRKHPRVPLEVLVQVRSQTVEEFKEVHGKNLSVGGMFIQTATTRPVGSQIYFQFTVKDGGTLIEGLAKVVHAAPQGMGVEFVSVLEPSASIIRALVEARLRP